ncbi:ferrous iron transport protein B [Paenibacillus thiaminolyticus]|uniref:Ferrous iron transport protein B n=1 Tax=Paenibacillus thiaminolyticus TaxID=49283 RepID=A0AAP9DT57_PANTH|nr:ferrous iron transport protein B [Paenibacillus thiaminolyticus]MCY9535768.1 ferrous iron transport protein B [Paenibacillus thiaminolyticus]MCY9601040.1 ferrous iron transport protein B [Paenibacillus thiaminolyticus]MCY9609485.1 ferrous iron transport protein B [Paenibacillus thiaminolyticus]MCY9613241.1 ferrous iron transport protein B [Paenibacillus thiaminolyticus]MCY9617656.1 ferrous iron transport protein B [Paenibacillus thiaminolyticus]
MSAQITALVGNPNTGKTSLFNALTRSYEYVGNWTGVTVEKKVGRLHRQAGALIDLPGIYSLHPMSRDESVAVQYLLDELPNAIVNVVDASQLERNLMLTVQLLEYGVPVYVALNMTDVAAGRGIHIDPAKLSSALGVPVIPVNARKKQGIASILERLQTQAAEGIPLQDSARRGASGGGSASALEDADSASPLGHEGARRSPLMLNYGSEVEQAIERIAALLPGDDTVPVRWTALQYIEQNETVRQAVQARISAEQARQIGRIIEEAEQRLWDSGAALHLPQRLRSIRMEFIRQVIASSVHAEQRQARTMTERLDNIVTNRWLGIPIFILIMFLTFKVTFDWLGTPLSDALDAFFSGPLTEGAAALLDAAGASSFTHALLEEGIIAGVGGVLVFVPQIFLLFLFISFIEDSGYMARVTVVMDRLMEAVGLNGKAFIPFVIGFGCNVPGIMAARTIEQPRERLVTTLLVPLMSCSARLSVYALFAGVFFQSHQAIVVLSLYLLSIVLSLLLAKLFTKRLMKEEHSIFVVELPPYRMPQWQTLFRSTWEKGKGFVRKAGTFILGGSVLIWFLTYAGPGGLGVEMDDSYLALIGGFLAPLLAPLGFGTWQAGAALLTGFLAKEIVVSTMNIIYHAPDAAMLQAQIAEAFTPLSAYTFCVFLLLYVPCLATVGILRKETASWRWTWFSIGYSLVLAYAAALVVTAVGRWLGYM